MSGQGTSVCHVLHQVPCHVVSCPSTPLVSCQAKVYQSLARFIHCHVISVMLQHTTAVMSGHGVPEPGYPLSCHICHVVAARHLCHVRPRCTRAWHSLSTVMSYLSCHVAAHRWCHVRPRCTGAWHGLSTVMSYLSCHVAAHHWCHVRPRCTRAWHGLSTGLIACWCPLRRPSTRTTLVKSSTPSPLASRYHWPLGLQNCQCFCCGLEFLLLVCCRNGNYQCKYEQNYATKHSVFH